MTLQHGLDGSSGNSLQPVDRTVQNIEHGGSSGKLDYQSVYNEVNKLRQADSVNGKLDSGQFKSQVQAVDQKLHQDGYLPNLHIQLDDKDNAKIVPDKVPSKQGADVTRPPNGQAGVDATRPPNGQPGGDGAHPSSPAAQGSHGPVRLQPGDTSAPSAAPADSPGHTEATADSKDRPPQSHGSDIVSSRGAEETADSIDRAPQSPGSDAPHRSVGHRHQHSIRRGGGGGHRHHRRHHHRHHHRHKVDAGQGDGQDSPDNESGNGEDKSKSGDSAPVAGDKQKPGADNQPQASDGNSTDSAGLRGHNNAEKAMNYFRDKGFTKEQAAGIVGNLSHEAPGVNPKQHQHGGGPGFGIAQWEGARKHNLYHYAHEHGKPADDLKTQLDYAWKEMNTTHRSALTAVQHSHTPEAAARAFEKHFEAAGRPHMVERERLAMNLYHQSDRMSDVEIATTQQ